MAPPVRRFLGSMVALTAVILLSSAPGHALQEDGGDDDCGFCTSECPYAGHDIWVQNTCDDLCGYGSGFEYGCSSPGENCSPFEVFVTCGTAN